MEEEDGLTAWARVVRGTSEGVQADQVAIEWLGSERFGPHDLKWTARIEWPLGWSDRPNPFEPSDLDPTACMHWCI